MRRFERRIISIFAYMTLIVLTAAAAWASPPQASNAPFKDLNTYVKYIQEHHRAPFDRDSSRLGTEAAQKLLERIASAPRAARQTVSSGTNVKVNQDRNPWPKAEIGAAVDPTNGNNYVVMANDFRENFDHEFYHVSTDGGASWTDDSMVGGADPVTGFVPLNFQSDPGVAFDAAGHSFISSITGNLIFDFFNGYINFDTEIEVAEGFGNGTYTNLLPIPIDDQPCDGTFSVFNCPATLDKPLITVDTVATSPNNGAIYVYYTLFCNANPCTDGSATVPPFSSAILESHSAGAGLPFSAPALVSGALTQTQFSSLVVDSHGTPHMFFDDFSNFSFTEMWESTLKGGVWVVSKNPVARFVYNGQGNINWGFRDFGSEAPGCGIHVDTAYCAFSANQIAGGKLEGSPSVYVAVVNTRLGGSTVHRVNNDTFNDGKHHFFAWATAKADGSVYVGWYDDRNDAFNTLVQYFVGKSTDGGKTFPVQMPVSDVPYNPCVGFPGCGFFGDYTQLVSGPDGVVHAAWQDTRDGASMQIWSQAITW
ncbi:MAG TPA: hypothetical protein VGT03_15580 [Candidatus Acidoferrales bacterium]|nr:hypothetical protein [Candidatus Acidoferrales bacterium]